VFIIVFMVTWFFFLIGLFTQLSGILMMASSYYLYALNAFAIGGRLSWDIFLVTLFLMCVTPYAGDYFSVDSLRRGDPEAYQRRRPYFLQRLLQMQIAFTYFYTGLYKITAEGNWLTANPIHYLMLYPPQGVTKNFMLKEFLANHPQLCYASGLLVVAVELLMPLILFWRKTRRCAIILGFLFHILLILTLDVPTIFFFQFPAQLLLFINPKHIVRWIEKKRKWNRLSPESQLIFNGQCQFCQASIRHLKIMDLFGCLRMLDYHPIEDLKRLHPSLSPEAAASQMHLIEPDGSLYGGFYALRRLCWKLPMLYPWTLIVYFPGSGILGPFLYRWVAKNRYLFHWNRTCRNNACFRK
jgi:predicted DCC family thiol-disulfide oxidoreductase YuxK